MKPHRITVPVIEAGADMRIAVAIGIEPEREPVPFHNAYRRFIFARAEGRRMPPVFVIYRRDAADLEDL